MQILFDKPFPKLNEFHFAVFWDEGRISPSREEVEEQLRGFNVTLEEDKEKGDFNGMVEPPANFPQGSSCKVVIVDRDVEPCTIFPSEMVGDYTSLEIHYWRGDVLPE